MCELCEKKGISFRCIKCGIQICDDCGDAEECLPCRLHTLLRRALICFGFYLIPIFCLAYGEIELHLPFLTMYQIDFDANKAGGYALFMWHSLNTLFGGFGVPWLGLGFFFASLSILKIKNLIVWERNKANIIANCIIAFIIVIMKTLYFIQILFATDLIFKILLILEIVLGLSWFYFSYRIASYKAKSRDKVNQFLDLAFIIVQILINIIYIIIAIIASIQGLDLPDVESF
jgi:hypothetical protein